MLYNVIVTMWQNVPVEANSFEDAVNIIKTVNHIPDTAPVRFEEAIELQRSSTANPT